MMAFSYADSNDVDFDSQAANEFARSRNGAGAPGHGD
jgi:hypothetical protein